MTRAKHPQLKRDDAQIVQRCQEQKKNMIVNPPREKILGISSGLAGARRPWGRNLDDSPRFVGKVGARASWMKYPMAQAAEETKIRTLVENWAKAARAKDMDGVLAHHAEDIVMFDVPMPVQSNGMEEYRKTWDLFFANSPGGAGSFDLTELRITAGDAVAYCHAILGVGDSSGRLTMGLRKESGRWLIAHEHHSYPMPTDAGQ